MLKNWTVAWPADGTSEQCLCTCMCVRARGRLAFYVFERPSLQGEKDREAGQSGQTGSLFSAEERSASFSFKSLIMKRMDCEPIEPTVHRGSPSYHINTVSASMFCHFTLIQPMGIWSTQLYSLAENHNKIQLQFRHLTSSPNNKAIVLYQHHSQALLF